jgi:hypothetical protein
MFTGKIWYGSLLDKFSIVFLRGLWLNKCIVQIPKSTGQVEEFLRVLYTKLTGQLIPRMNQGKKIKIRPTYESYELPRVFNFIFTEHEYYQIYRYYRQFQEISSPKLHLTPAYQNNFCRYPCHLKF